MTAPTYTNAPAPHGALFDDAPAVSAPARKTSDDYAPCVAVWPCGKTQRANVKRVRLDTVEQARRKLASGLVAWVRVEDADAVLAAVRGVDGESNG